MKLAASLMLILCTALGLRAQEYAVTVGSNIYVPISSTKSMYPILWVDDDYSPSVLVGGLSVGISRLGNWTDKVDLKYSATFMRVVYWEEEFRLHDEFNVPLGSIPASSTDYLLNVSALAKFKLGDRMSAGAGLGIHAMITSSLYFRREFGNSNWAGKVGNNKFYKPFMPAMPLEISYHTKKRLILNMRYEQALLNRYKKDLAQYSSDRYGILILEMGFKLNQQE
jgi:hypothetical protein